MRVEERRRRQPSRGEAVEGFGFRGLRRECPGGGCNGAGHLARSRCRSIQHADTCSHVGGTVPRRARSLCAQHLTASFRAGGVAGTGVHCGSSSATRGGYRTGAAGGVVARSTGPPSRGTFGGKAREDFRAELPAFILP